MTIADQRALGPVTLTGSFVRLEPLELAHAAALLEAAQSEEIWTWMSADPRTLPAMEAWITTAQRAQREGREVPFTVVRVEDGRVIGSTRYMEIQPEHRGVEIGWTWYAVDSWGGVVNPEAKYLLLEHAFERWGAIRVQLKTDRLNVHSQAAIRKLGALEEGTLRQHRIRRDGSLRDSVVFSILDREWPAVKAQLRRRIDRASR